MSERRFLATHFEKKILKANSNEFESFFCEIMKANHGTKFTMIAPYGNIGDRKNDGYFHKDGIFYQAYGPEDLKKKTTQINAISKLEKDFRGLIEHQNQGNWTEVKEFYFVINDKMGGIKPDLAKKAQDLSDEFLIPISFLTAIDLKNEFFKLSKEQKEDILSVDIPDEIDYAILNYNILSDAIIYILNLDPLINSSKEKLIVSDFEKKIIFNNLNLQISGALNSHCYYYDDLVDFFQKDTENLEDELKEVFSKLYNEALEITSCSNEQFKHIYMSALDMTKAENKSLRTSVLSLMAYFFSTCDIFEIPQ